MTVRSAFAQFRRSARRILGLAPAPWDDVALIGASGLFDVNLYLIEGPDIRPAGVDPVVHFCTAGWREGRRPNFYFDPLWYAERYLGDSGENPLAHYIRTGEAAGLSPICTFDPAWYRRTYRLPRRTSPLAHFLANRRSQRFAPNPHFDLDFYLSRHGDEIGPNRDPFAHLLRHGAGRDLDPSASFDSAAYRRTFMPSGSAAARTKWTAADLAVPLVHHLDASARAAQKAQRR